MPTDRKRSVLLLSVAAVALALIGAGLIGAYAILSKRVDNEGAVPTGSMREWTPEEAIVERLAILTLAGWTDQAVIDRCLLEGEVDTALSVLANSVTLEDRTRAGLLLRIAPVYSNQNRPDLAGALYHKVGIIAILSPGISDLTRIELLLQVATGLTQSKQEESAIATLDQVAALVQLSTELKPAQRRQLAEAAMAGYEAAGDSKNANASALMYLDTPATNTPAARGPIPGPVIEKEVVIIPESYQNVVIARQEAAMQLVQSLEQHPGEWPMSLVAGLADVLKAEDTVVMGLNEQDYLPASARVEIELQWLAMKSGIADGRMGGSLVPEWESQSEQIDDMLHAAWIQYCEFLLTDPESARAIEWDVRRLSQLRAELLAGELGLIPGYDVAAGAMHVQQAVEEMETVEGNWVLGISVEEDTPHYSVLSP